MLTPGMVNRIKRDYLLLLNGPDGVDAVITWNNPDIGGVVDPVYNELSGPAVSGTMTVRCHVNKVFGEGEIKSKALADVQANDAIFLFANQVDLTGKGALLVAIPNFGTWKPVDQPPNVFQNYVRLIVNNGENFAQAVYMRRYSGT